MSLRAPVTFHDFRGHRIVTAPAQEPVTVSEVKTHLVLSGTDDDTFIGDLIEEARQEIEDFAGIAMIDQTWRLTLDRWPGYREPWWDGVKQGAISELYGVPNALELPRYPLSSVTSVTTYDEASNSTAVSVSNVFDVDTAQGRIALQSGQTWPIALRPTNAIEIVYVAGYGATGASVPAPLKRAVRSMAAYLYEHRGECTTHEAMKNSGALAIAKRYGRGRL